MKKTLKIISLAIVLCVTMSSCETILGGPITECQRTKPAGGVRELRVGALVVDIKLIW